MAMQNWLTRMARTLLFPIVTGIAVCRRMFEQAPSEHQSRGFVHRHNTPSARFLIGANIKWLRQKVTSGAHAAVRSLAGENEYRKQVLWLIEQSGCRPITDDMIQLSAEEMEVVD